MKNKKTLKHINLTIPIDLDNEIQEHNRVTNSRLNLSRLAAQAFERELRRKNT